MEIKNLSDPKSRRDFVRRNHTCIVSYARKAGPPSMSIVHYVMDGDDIAFLTRSERGKAKAVRREGELSICVLDGQPRGLTWPPEYVVVFGKATLDGDLDRCVELAFRVAPIMTGEPLPEAAAPIVREMMKKGDRVIVRVTPESTFHSPAVHPDDSSQVVEGADSAKALHSLATRLPWRDAE